MLIVLIREPADARKHTAQALHINRKGHISNMYRSDLPCTIGGTTGFRSHARMNIQAC